MGQPRIFVSYNRADAEFTQRLVDELHRAGAQVWVDVAGVQHGNFMERINEALEHCQWMVLVLSPSAIASTYVRDEVFTALHRVMQGYMLGVIPILAVKCEPSTIPAQWDVLQRYDATQDANAALAGVLWAVGLPTASEAQTGTDSQTQPTETFDEVLTRGNKLADQRDWTNAAACFERAAQMNPASAEARSQVARVYWEAGRHAEALVAADRAIALDGQTAETWNIKGKALRSLRRHEEALSVFDRALAINPNVAAYWSNKGAALLSLHRYEEALANLERAVTLSPNSALGWRRKGDALSALKRREDAVMAYDCALAADPKNELALKGKTVALRALGHET
jgi:tetratricopeptide (TPR) repeat protein